MSGKGKAAITLIGAGLLLALAATAFGVTGGGGLQLVSRADGRHGAPRVPAYAPSISANGRYVAFLSHEEIFRRDLHTDDTRHLGKGREPVLSADGGHLAYVDGGEVYALDLKSGARTLVSRPAPHMLSDGGGYSTGPSISANGRYVAFSSTSGDLIDEDGDRRLDDLPSLTFYGPPEQVYVRDLVAETTTLISRVSGLRGKVFQHGGVDPAISANGRHVAFVRRVPAYPEPETDTFTQIVIRDLRTGRTRRSVFRPRNDRTPPFDYGEPAISANGRYVAFGSSVGGGWQVFVRDMKSGSVRLASKPRHNADGFQPTISADGRYVAFISTSEVSGEKLFLRDLHRDRPAFVHDAGDSSGGPPAISADGRFLAFDTLERTNSSPGPWPSDTLTPDYTPAEATASLSPVVRLSGEVYRYTNPLD